MQERIVRAQMRNNIVGVKIRMDGLWGTASDSSLDFGDYQRRGGVFARWWGKVTNMHYNACSGRNLPESAL